MVRAREERADKQWARRPRPLLAAGIAVIALITVGCSAEHHAKVDAEPEVNSIPTLVDSAALRLPLDAYMFSPTELRLVGEAHRVLVRKCMRRAGFDYRPPEPSAQRPARTWNARRYGLTDAAAVAVHGYDLDVPSANRTRIPRARRLPHNAAELRALTGGGHLADQRTQLSPGGCVGEAMHALAGSGPRDRDLAQRLSFDTYYISQRDSRVQAVIKRWSHCMSARGFTYATPINPPGDARFRNGLGRKEIATAKADVACKQQTNVVGVWFAVESAYQDRQIAAHLPALQEIRKANADEVRRAAAIVPA
jgi:hypothetical protein